MKLNGSGYMAHFAGFILIGIFKISFARKSKCGGPEEEIEGVHGRRKRKKLISGTEGEIVVAHGRLSSSARLTNVFLFHSFIGFHCRA